MAEEEKKEEKTKTIIPEWPIAIALILATFLILMGQIVGACIMLSSALINAILKKGFMALLSVMTES